jgi:ABC-2 type transport system ATP-binding protein
MVRTHGLTKSYGPVTALTGVDLRVPDGAVYGLVGPNGSGKTTLLEIVAGLRRPTSGELSRSYPREAVGYCPDVAEFEPWLTATEVLQVALGLLGCRRTDEQLSDLLHRVGIGDAADRHVGGFSRGMTTRLNLAAGLVADPGLLLVDEPTSALDPSGRIEILQLISSLAPSATVVISSHDLAEVEAVCTHVGILAVGRLRYQGSLTGLLAGTAQLTWYVAVRPPADAVLQALRRAPWVCSVQEPHPGELELVAADAAQVETELPRLLATCNARVLSFSVAQRNLQDAFLALTNRSAPEFDASDQPQAS